MVLKWYTIPLLILLGWLFDSLKYRIPVNVEHWVRARSARARLKPHIHSVYTREPTTTAGKEERLIREREREDVIEIQVLSSQ